MKTGFPDLVAAPTEFSWPYIEFLVNFMNANQIHSVVDLGCGDWCFSRYINWGLIQYTGIDVVKSVIERNQKLYSTSTISFQHGDILDLELPNADLLICKDVFMHLTNDDITNFLTKIGQFKHCLFTYDITKTETFSVEPLNENMEVDRRGGYRPLDLTKPPFNLKGTKILTYAFPEGSVKQVSHIKQQNN